MKWAFFSIVLAVVAVLAIPALFAWVGWLAFAEARITGVNVIPAMIFVGMCLAAWTAFLQILDIFNDWIATKGKVNIAQTQGEVAEGIRGMTKLQREQANTLAATMRAMAAAQGNNGHPAPVGGLDFEDG